MREDAELDGGEDRPGQAGRRGAEHEREQLQAVHRHAHHLGGERVLAERTPRPPGARVVDELQRHDHHGEDAEREPEVAADRAELVAEDADRVDVRDPVRAAGDVGRAVVPRECDPVGVRRQHDVDLREEERHDREVVADQPPRRQPEQQPEQRRGDDHDRDREQRREVEVELRRREQRVEVGAEAVERDEAEVEQARPADDDVQSERQQREEDGVDRDADHVLRARDEGEERRDADRGHEQDPPRAAARRAHRAARAGRRAAGALLGAGDPLVGADLRALGCSFDFAHALIPSGCPPFPAGRSAGRAAGRSGSRRRRRPGTSRRRSR